MRGDLCSHFHTLADLFWVHNPPFRALGPGVLEPGTLSPSQNPACAVGGGPAPSPVSIDENPWGLLNTRQGSSAPTGLISSAVEPRIVSSAPERWVHSSKRGPNTLALDHSPGSAVFLGTQSPPASTPQTSSPYRGPHPRPSPHSSGQHPCSGASSRGPRPSAPQSPMLHSPLSSETEPTAP